MDRKPSVVKSAAAMSAGTMLSRVLGYIRDVVILSFLPRLESDAFVVAFRLPNLMRRLLGEGSLAVSFVPVFVEHLEGPGGDEKQKRDRAYALAKAIFTLLTALTMSLSAGLALFMEPVLNLWVGGEAGFSATPGKLELTVELGRIMISYLFLVTTYAYLMAVANSLHRFFGPALAPALFNAMVIVFAWVPTNWFGGPSQSLAWGVIAGGIVQVALVVGVLVKERMLPWWTLNLRVPGVSQVVRNMVPGLVGLGVFQLMTLANTYFAARLGEGAQTYIYAGDRILELPQSLIAISLGAALLPTMSRQLSQGNMAELLKTAREGLLAMLFLALPAAVGMVLLAQPIVEVLFQRKEFTQDDVMATASVIQVYALLLVASSIAKVTAPAFYARKQTWVPARVAAVVLVVHVAFAAWAIQGMGLVGLALATALSGVLNMILLQILFNRGFGRLGYSEIFKSLMRMVPALLAMGLLIQGLYPALQSLGRVVALMIVISASVVVYFAVAYAMGSREAVATYQVISRKLKARLPSVHNRR